MQTQHNDQLKILCVRVPKGLKEKMQEAADSDRRSVSNWLSLLLEQRYIKNKAA